MKTPLSVVKERFGDKQKLVAAVEKLASSDLWLDRVSDRGLAHVSNTKLLRLHDTLSTTKKDFGSRKKLISAIVELENRSKDEGLMQRLEGYPLPRLLDLHRAAKKRAASRAAKAEARAKQAAPTKKKRPLSLKAKAKARG